MEVNPSPGPSPIPSGRLAPGDVEELLRHRDWLRSLIAGLVRDPWIERDVEQEVWLRALRFSRRVRDAKSLLASLSRGLALNRWRGEERRRRREAESAREEASSTTGSHADPSELAARAELERRVIGHLLALDEPYRATLLLRFFEDASCEDIAARRGEPAATVRSRVHRGLARLRELMDSDEGSRGWRAAFAPVAAGAFRSGEAVVAASLAGVAVMKWKLAALVALVVVGVFSVALLVDRDRPRSELETAVAPVGPRDLGAAADEPAPVRADVELPTKPAASSPSPSPTAESAPLLATIAGRVMDVDTKTPFAGASIKWSGGATSLSLADRQVLTDAGGGYRFGSVPTGGSIQIEITPEDSLGSSRSVAIPAGAEHVVDLWLDPSTAIAGRVLDAVSGRAIAGAELYVRAGERGYDDPLPRAFEAQSDGTFRIGVPRDALRAGRVSVRAGAPGFAYSCVSAREAETLDIVLLPGCRIEGSVRSATGEFAAGLDVALVIDSIASERAGIEWPKELKLDSRESRTRTGVDGRFVLTGLPPGVVGRVVASLGNKPVASEACDLRAAGSVSTVSLVIPAPGAAAAIEGVLSIHGKPGPMDFWICEDCSIHAAMFRERRTSGPDGRYRVDGLKPGPAVVRVSALTGLGRTESIVLTPGATARLDIDVSQVASRIAGRVLGTDGKPAAGALLTLCPVESQLRAGDKGFELTLRTDADGGFSKELDVPVGTELELRIRRGAETIERRIRTGDAGDEGHEIVVAPLGQLRLVVMDAGTGAPIQRPALRLRRAGAVDFTAIDSRWARVLPGDVVEWELPVGAIEIEVDRDDSFAAPVRRTVEIVADPASLRVEVPPTR